MLKTLKEKLDPKATATPTKEAVAKRHAKYQKYAVYVRDGQAHAKMLRGLKRAYDLLEAGKIHQANAHLDVVKRSYVMARYSNNVLKYRADFGGWMAILFLALYSVTLHYGMEIFYQGEGQRLLFAFVGGGLGGTTLVMFGLVGLEIQTSGIIHRSTWYVFKPIVGGIIGLVVFLAVDLGAEALSTPVEELRGVFLVGFLGGFFETFSSRALTKAAGLAAPD